MSGFSQTATAPDISACEREPIHIPGAIQPYGVLLALHPSDLRIVQASANYSEMFPRVNTSVSEQLFDHWAGDDNRDVLERILKDDGLESNPLRFRDLAEDGFTLGTVHRSGDLIVLELENESNAGDLSSGLLRMRNAASRLERMKTQSSLFEAIVEEMQSLCAFDRVMLYRFAEDWHGEVVAERTNPGVDSYLGLHYPASDIPSQARELYRTNWIRYIPDASYASVPINSLHSQITPQPLDLSQAYLRSVSPVHLEYLKNMKVGATLTVSLVQNGRLWGLIAMHHQLTKTVSYETRSAAEFFGRLASLQLSALQEKDALIFRIESTQIRDRLVASLGDNQVNIGMLATNGADLLALTRSDGAAIVVHDAVISVGSTPPEAGVRAIADWICSRKQDILMTSSLSQENHAFDLYPEASGTLGIVISRDPNISIIWFRNELLRSLTWGGDPHKSLELGEGGQLSPRRSFARWTETQRLCAVPWKAGTADAVHELQSWLTGMFAKRASLLEKSNADLSYANRELDEFAHIASHDLKEPLRGIHNYASYLIDDYADLLDDEGRDKLNTLVRLTQRMDTLIESLLQLSRFGRVDFEHAITDLDGTIAQVLELFGPRIEGRRARVSVAKNFPLVRADAVRIAEVFNNLISNALKYSDQSEPQVEIGYILPGNQQSLLTIYVRDDGIGIPERHHRSIFQMFKRLHAADKYGGGTGAGLALALRIVERHGGTMWVTSEPKKGTTMYFTLEVVN